jgi:hypothetical protein
VSDKLVERLREKVAQLPQDRHPGCFTVTVGAQDCLALADRIEELERALREAMAQRLLYAAEHWCTEECSICALNAKMDALLTPSAAPERQ